MQCGQTLAHKTKPIWVFEWQLEPVAQNELNKPGVAVQVLVDQTKQIQPGAMKPNYTVSESKIYDFLRLLNYYDHYELATYLK